MEDYYTYKETRVPVRVIIGRHQSFDFGVPARAKKRQNVFGQIARGAFVLGLAYLVVLGSSGTALLAAAFEAHVVNVTATIEPREEPEKPEEPENGEDGNGTAGSAVVINEIMWMGSENDSGEQSTTDEWLELRNMTDADVEVGEWIIENAKAANQTIEISAGAVIPAGGFYLISHWSVEDDRTRISVSVDEIVEGISLANTYGNNGALILRDVDGNEIDRTPAPNGGNWPAGVNASGTRWSMERNFEPGDGSDSGSWHTCDRDLIDEDQLAVMTSYWKEDAQNFNCGTPGNPNLSKNDPTFPVIEEEGEDEEEKGKPEDEEEAKPEDEDDEYDEESEEEPAEPATTSPDVGGQAGEEEEEEEAEEAEESEEPAAEEPAAPEGGEPSPEDSGLEPESEQESSEAIQEE